MEPAQRRKVALSGLALLFITGPAIFATWWYMFSSTPPYQWFRENGFPTMNYPLLWIGVPAVIGFVILGVVLWSIRRENTASEPRFGAPEYYELLNELAEKKKASAKSQSVTLSAIAETARNRRAFFPPSQSQKDSEIWAGIKSAWEEAGNLRQEWHDNESDPPVQKTEEYINRTLAFAKENLTFDEIRKLDSPFEQAPNIFDPMRSRMDMVNYWWGRLNDYERHLQTIMRTYSPRSVVLQPATIPAPQRNSLEVTFENSDYLIVRVINHDPDRHAKIKSVTVFGIKNGDEKQILSTKLPNDPDVTPGGWKLGSLSLPYSLGPRDAQNFKTVILEANLRVYGNTAYFAEVALQTGEAIRSEVIPTKPREGVIRPNLALIDQGVVGTPDRATRFFFTVKNVGPILVEKTDFAFVIQTEKLANPPVVKHEPHSQPIPEGLTRQVSYIFPTVDPEPAYIAFYISYIGEGQDTKWDNAPVFFGFRGVKDGIPNPELEYLRDEDVNRFKEYLRKHELPKPLL